MGWSDGIMRGWLGAMVLFVGLQGCRATTPSSPPPVTDTTPEGPHPDDREAIGQSLGGDGLVGWMHASIPEQSVWVWTYRSASDFFAFSDFVLVPKTSQARETLATVRRHDRVRLVGALVRHSGQDHIHVEHAEVVRAYEGWTPGLPSVTRPDPFGSDGSTEGRVIGRVHAVETEGESVLVLEVDGQVLPVRVPQAVDLSELYRGDIVRVEIEVASEPEQPVHIRMTETPFEVLDAMVSGHGQPIEREGVLVRFPQSPQILFDVFALQTDDGYGVFREYTLVNFDDEATFTAIRAKLASAWAEHTNTVVDGRNKEVNPALHIRARGIKNMIAPNQANPQILITSPDDIEIIAQPEDPSGHEPR